RMSQRTPPKSKTTARTLIAASATSRPGRQRWWRRGLVGREGSPAALLQAVLVELAALLARRAVALELRDGVVGAGLVPLFFSAGTEGPTGGENTRGRDEPQESACHDAHDTMAPPCF